MHYYQFNIPDWALHTSHLTVEEEGVFRRLLDYYYDTEQPIPEKTQPVIRRLRLGSHEETVRLILQEFFVLIDGNWHNLRADQEIADYNSKAETARENGRKGGRPKKQKHKKQQVSSHENPEKTQLVIAGFENKTQKKPNQEPLTTNQEPLLKTNGDLSPSVIVFDYWVSVMDKPKSAKLTKERKRLIDQRIKEKYTVEDIKRAIDGCHASEFHMGKNDGGKVHNDLTLICRNGSKLEQFMDSANKPNSGKGQQFKPSQIKYESGEL